MTDGWWVYFFVVNQKSFITLKNEIVYKGVKMSEEINVLERKNCKLTGCKCDAANCPDTVAGFSVFEVYGRACRHNCR